jgi:hypothetical protein
MSFPIATWVSSLDSRDGALTVSVSNIGNQNLTFTSVSSYPANFPENSSDADPCVAGTPVKAGASCDVSANFLATILGIIGGSVVLTDNTLNQANATQTIFMSGFGIQPTQLAFGTLPPHFIRDAHILRHGFKSPMRKMVVSVAPEGGLRQQEVAASANPILTLSRWSPHRKNPAHLGGLQCLPTCGYLLG